MCAHDFTSEERNLYTTVFKKRTQQVRAAIRAVRGLMEMGRYAKYQTGLQVYKSRLEESLIQICQEIISFIQFNCLPIAISIENQAYFTKLVADYNRYMLEASPQMLGFMRKNDP